MKQLCVVLSAFCLFFMSGAGQAMLDEPIDGSSNSMVSVCSSDCPYLFLEEAEATEDYYVFVEEEYLQPYWDRGEVPLSAASLEVVLCAIENGHTHSFVFQPSMGCTDLDCINPEHTHYR